MGYQQKSYKKFVATAATATLVASAIVPVASAAGFADVPADNEFAPYINALVDQDIIKGYASDNTFRPGNKLTRGQVAIMLGRWLEKNGATVPADWETNPRFEDVSSSNTELAKYAALVKEAGVFTGVKGKLNPSQNITRENMAVVLDRVAEEVAGVSLVELAKEIEDVKVEDLATAQTAYQDEIQALADLKISTVSNFRPKEQVSRAHFAKFLYKTIEVIKEAADSTVAVESVKAVNGTVTVTLKEKAEKVDVKDFTVTQAINGGTATKVTPSAAELSEDGLTVTLTVDKVAVDATTEQSVVYTVNKVAAEAFVVASAPEVTSVSAINAKGLKVTFNEAVDTSKASIVVKKGSVTVNVEKIEFADDKKSAVITTTAKLTKGEYSVSVSGLTEEALTKSVQVEDEKVAKINILSSTAPLNPVDSGINDTSTSTNEFKANETAFVQYEVLNQYGEKMTNQTITWNQSTGGQVVDNGQGKLTITNTATAGVKFIPGNKVYLTGVHGSTATVVNAEVTIGLAAQASSVEIKGVYNTLTKKIEELPSNFTANKYVLLFEVKDQYGNKLDITDATGFTILSDNPLFIDLTTPNVVGTNVTIDNVDYEQLKLVPGSQATKGGTANVQIISNNTGKVAKYTITASAQPAVANFSITTPEKLIAGGEKVEVPFTAVDQYGNAVTNFTALDGIVTLTGGLDFEKQQDGTAKLYFTAPANNTTNDNIVTVSTLVPGTGNYSNLQLTVKPKAKPEAVLGINSEISTQIAAGNEAEITGEDLLVQDQYGRTLTKEQLTTWLAGTDVEGGDNAIVITSTQSATTPFEVIQGVGSDAEVQEISLATDSIKVKAVAAGVTVDSNEEKLVFALSTASAPTAIQASAKSIAFTRVVQSEYASYEVADLGTMFNNATAGTATNTAYNVTPKVYGVTASGAKVLLPASKYTISVGDAKLDTTTPGVIADKSTGGYSETDFQNADTSAKDITVKVNFLINDENGAAAATITKDLIVSAKTAVATTITLKPTVVNGSAFVGAGAITADSLINVIKEVKDQYGVAYTTAPAITISNVNKVEDSTLAVTDNATAGVAISGAITGDKFTATFAYAGGKTETVNFVVADASTVVLAAGSVGTAGNGKVTGLTSSGIYAVKVGDKYYGVKADGTLDTTEEDTALAAYSHGAALTGTEITGLTNGTLYSVSKKQD